jgi:single-strand DNA-binding protein
VTEVVADNVRLLESRSQSESRAQQGNQYQDSYQAPYGQPSYAQPSYSQPSYNDNAGMSDDFGGSPLDISSDDLPF